MHATEAKELTRKYYINKFFGQYASIFDKIREAAQTGAYYVTLPHQPGKKSDLEKFKILMREYFDYAVLIKIESENPATGECQATLVIDWEKA